jgi:hypothetical protein
VDKELGTQNGAHYFLYNDQQYKALFMQFLTPLIIGCSYADWEKSGRLDDVIKLPDLTNLIMTLAAMRYRKGYDGFVTKCTRPIVDDQPVCGHTETITADLFKMIITRYSAMNKACVEHMIETRMGSKKHSLAEIKAYQDGLGLEGEVLRFGNMAFTMKIPSVAEHLDAGAKFLSDIVNEVSADNTQGHYIQAGFRYTRTFLPWINSLEMTSESGGSIKTSDLDAITRILDDTDEEYPDGEVREAMRTYINKVQLTYVGYPATKCPKCGHTADTPSGLMTLDPFIAFFTLAFLSLKLKPSVLSQG